MNDLKTNYEVIAIGNIHMRTMQNSQVEKILAQNHNAIEEIRADGPQGKGRASV